MAASQIDRPFRLKSPLGADALLLESFEGWERISTPFRFTLRVLSPDPDIDMKGLLTKPLVMSIVLSDGKERHIHGNISRMKLLADGDDSLGSYEIEMSPGFWFLNLFTNCRIFQNMTVQDIVTAVFKSRDFSDYDFQLQGAYPQREYCVQYRETDFNFVSRLLEEEGIYYYFAQTPDKHTMMLVDQKETLKVCEHMKSARYTPSTGGRLDEDTVVTLEEEAQVRIGAATLADYDFEKPATDLSTTLPGKQPGEFYDYPGEYVTKDDGERYARIRLEAQEVGVVTVSGQTNCMGFECGYKFTLEEHYRQEANQEYTLVAIAHRGRNTSYRAGPAPTPFEYRNNIEAIPASVDFRPQRAAKKSVVEGVQTAVVVGASGEEIWTDQYGRVKVQFRWDRDGKDDDKSSCWIRVSHAWAGKLWGSIYIPRVGQEVIVSFLEGDPDRPIITGRVYNADQMPPYALPDQGTKSTLKSMSSKGGGGFNELRFEDKQGSEQVFLSAEKDLDIRVKNDRKEWIGQDRHLMVTRNRLEQIGQDHFLEIKGKEGIKITGAHSLSVQGDVVETFKGSQSTDVSQNIYIKGAQIVIEAQMGLTLKVGGNFITIDPSGVAVKGTMIQLNSAGAALSGTPGDRVPLTAPTEADKADPGGVTGAPAIGVTNPNNLLSLTTIAPEMKPEAADEPDRQAPAPGGKGGGTSSQTEYATFPKDVDPAAVAASLKEAAQTGVPFCEECEKARKAAETNETSSA